MSKYTSVHHNKWRKRMKALFDLAWGNGLKEWSFAMRAKRKARARRWVRKHGRNDISRACRHIKEAM